MNHTLMPYWHELGERVRSMQERSGRTFQPSDIVNIDNPHVLIKHLLEADSAHRVAYSFHDVCFIQMRPDEENWIVVKGRHQFDAITSIEYGPEGLLVYLLCVFGATETECRNQQYLVSDTYFRGYSKLKDHCDLSMDSSLSEHIQVNH